MTRSAEEHPSAVLEGTAAPDSPLRLRPVDLGIAALLVALTAAAFWPSLPGEILLWDDDQLLLDNPHYHGFAADNLGWMFTTRLLGHYQPGTWLSYALDWTLGGLDSTAFHRTNLILFICSVWVFYRLTLRVLVRSFPADDGAPSHAAFRAAAVLAALLYAVHPLRVETVAWITNRAYLLSGLLILLSVNSYLHYAEARDNGRSGLGLWTASLVFFAASLLCRANGVALPFVLLLLDVIPLRRLSLAPQSWSRLGGRKVWLEKIPFFIVAAAAAALAYWAKSSADTVATVAAIPIALRIAMAAYAAVFYLQKTLWPTGLLPLYEKPAQMDPFDPLFLICGTIVIGITLALFVFRRRWPAGWVCWLGYVIILIPMSGLVQIGAQMAADRYTQLACLGWSVLAAGGLLKILPRRTSSGTRRFAATTVWIVSAALVLVLIPISRKQCRVWLDSETLWSFTVEGDPDCYVGLNNLAAIHALAERREEAERLWKRALALRPELPDVYLHLGTLALEQLRIDEALAYLHKAESLSRKPDGDILCALAIVAVVQGDLDLAMTRIQDAVELEPDSPKIRYNLGMIHLRAGRLEEAERAFNEALRLRPGFPKARNQLDRLHQRKPLNRPSLQP